MLSFLWLEGIVKAKEAKRHLYRRKKPNRPKRKNPAARAEEGQQGMRRGQAKKYRRELARCEAARCEAARCAASSEAAVGRRRRVS